jgi:DNA-binding Xre family transcriptional regulator
MIVWNFRIWLAKEHEIFSPAQLQKVLVTRAGVRLSLQALSSLMKNRPGALRFQTMQAICNALNCRLSDFCQMTPDVHELGRLNAGDPKRLYGSLSKDISKERFYPDPSEYFPIRKRRSGNPLSKGSAI